MNHMELAAAIIMAEKEIAALEGQITTLKQQIRRDEEALAQHFEQNPGLQDFSYGGRRWSLEVKTFITPEKGMQDMAVQWIAEHGGDDLIKPAMHHARRDSFLREMFLTEDGTADIPQELAGIVKATDVRRIRSVKS